MNMAELPGPPPNISTTGAFAGSLRASKSLYIHAIHESLEGFHLIFGDILRNVRTTKTYACPQALQSS